MVDNVNVAIAVMSSSFISLVAISFVLYIFIKFEKIRTFEFKLVCLLLLSDWLWVLTNFFVAFTYLLIRNKTQISNEFLCQSQASIYTFATINAVIYTSCIAYTLKSDIYAQPKSSNEQLLLFIIPPIISLIIAIIPIFFNAYGPADPLKEVYCHFNLFNFEKSRKFLIYSIDLPMTLGFLYNIYSILGVIFYIRNQMFNKVLRQRILSLLIFPAIILILWILVQSFYKNQNNQPSYTYTIQALYDMNTSTSYDVMLYVFINLVGFCDSLFYCYNSIFSQLQLINGNLYYKQNTQEITEIDISYSVNGSNQNLIENKPINNAYDEK